MISKFSHEQDFCHIVQAIKSNYIFYILTSFPNWQFKSVHVLILIMPD